MIKIRIAKFQGPIDPPRYQEPPQIVQDVPPLDLKKLFGEPAIVTDVNETEQRVFAFLNEDNNYGQ